MNAPSLPNPPDKWRPPLQVVLVIVLWTSLVFIFAMGLYLTGLNSPFPISVGEAAYQALRDWLPWMLASPLILWLANRFRIERHAWRSSIAIHIAAGLLLTFAYQGLLLQTRLAAPTMFISGFGSGGGAVSGGAVLEG
ncbi:MAG: hypothetical protein K0Q55_1910, partial [Verrucomicrobia bacterium]|nr:hypothetical protein [Verrucomicrobiota bacterium]